MKLKDNFVTRDMGGTQVMVAVGGSAFSGIVRSNKTAGFIVDLLKTDTTKDQILSTVLDKYDVDPQTAEKDIEKVLEKLRGIGALDE